MRKTVALFDALRDRLGFGIDFVHDVHERIAPAEAVELARELEPYKLFFLEDALPVNQTEYFERMRQVSTLIMSPCIAISSPVVLSILFAYM